MTEAQWLTSDDPEAMYKVAAQGALNPTWPDSERTHRKRDFFTAACCRLVWPWIAVDERCRRAIEEMEAQFDTPIPEDELDDIWDGVKQAARHPEDGTSVAQLLAANLVYDAQDAATVILRLVADYDFDEWGPPRARAAQVASVMRDIVGNPFRPSRFNPSWGSADVMLLAQGIYTDRAFDRLPILADALQDAGCEDEQLLDHCRSSGPHVRGCWVVDLVLGNE